MNLPITIIITVVACMAITWRAVLVLNFSGTATRRPVVWAHRTVAMAAFSAGVGALGGWNPDSLLALLAVSVAGLMLLCQRTQPDRRKVR